VGAGGWGRREGHAGLHRRIWAAAYGRAIAERLQADVWVVVLEHGYDVCSV
jgi:hypothetical protein